MASIVINCTVKNCVVYFDAKMIVSVFNDFFQWLVRYSTFFRFVASPTFTIYYSL